MRTTLTIDDDIASKLHAYSMHTGKSFKGVVNEVLRTGLLSQKQTQTLLKPFKVKARALGIKPGYSYDNVYELLEQLEGPGYK